MKSGFYDIDLWTWLKQRQQKPIKPIKPIIQKQIKQGKKERLKRRDYFFKSL
jgi:hypothetical protein